MKYSFFFLTIVASAISLARSSENKVSEVNRVIVDFTKKSEPLTEIWNSTGFSPADIVSTHEMKAVIGDVGSLGTRAIKYIRPHYLLNLVVARGMGSNHPQYDWSRLDQTLDVMTGSGLKLVFELMGFPADGSDIAASAYDKNFQEQLVHRKSYFDDLRKPEQIRNWKRFVKDLATHLELRYGRNEIREWLFETTNEPNLTHFWGYSREVFFNYYDACSEGLKGADTALKFGGPGSAAPELNGFFTGLMDHCERGLNFFTGERGVRIDFISVHVKDQPRRMIAREMKCIGYLRSNYPSLKMKPFINDEADPIVGWAKPYWWECGPWYACFVAQNLDLHQRLMGPEKGVNYRLFSNDHMFLGSWDQRTTHALFRAQPGEAGFTLIRKPVLSVMELIAGLGTRLFPAKVPANLEDHFGVIPTKVDGKISILVYNQTPIKIDRNPKPEPDKELAVMKSEEVKCMLTMHGLPSDRTQLKIQRIDEQHGNPYRLWVGMGRPKILTEKQIDLLKRAEPPETILSREIACSDHTQTLEMNFPSPSVSLITIEKIRK